MEARNSLSQGPEPLGGSGLLRGDGTTPKSDMGRDASPIYSLPDPWTSYRKEEISISWYLPGRREGDPVMATKNDWPLQPRWKGHSNNTGV